MEIEDFQSFRGLLLCFRSAGVRFDPHRLRFFQPQRWKRGLHVSGPRIMHRLSSHHTFLISKYHRPAVRTNEVLSKRDLRVRVAKPAVAANRLAVVEEWS